MYTGPPPLFSAMLYKSMALLNLLFLIYNQNYEKKSLKKEYNQWK